MNLAMVNWYEIMLIALVILLLFGATKIPQIMRGMGQGITEFKKGLREGPQPEGPQKEPPPGPPPSQ